MRPGFIALLVVFTATTSFAQQLFVQRYDADAYKGATQNWDVTQDSRGVLYFANNDGVLTFDGRDWNLMPTPNKDFISAVGLDSRNRVYVASYNELGYFEKDAKAQYQYTSITSILPAELRDFKYMDQLVVHNDSAFFIDHLRVYCYTGNRFQVYDEPNAKLLRHRDKLYLVKKNGVYHLTANSFQPLPVNAHFDRLAIKWIGPYHDALLVLDQHNSLWTINTADETAGTPMRLPYTLSAFIREGMRFRLTSLDNGNLALLTYDQMLILDSQLNVLYRISAEAIGEKFTNRIIYEDARHNLWITTHSSILQVITSSPLSFYDRHNGLSGKALSLGKTSNHVYAGTSTGVFYASADDSFALVPGTEGEAWNFYNVNDKLYLAHRTGVFEMKGSEATRLVDLSYVHALCPIKSNPDRLIAGTYNLGIWRLDRKGVKWTKTKIQGFEEETRFIFEDDDGSLWISHYNKGIYKLWLNNRMDTVISSIFYDSNKGLPSNDNNRLYRSRNNALLVTTTRGIYRYDAVNDRFEPHAAINEALGDISIYTLAEDDEGNFYYWGTVQQRESAGLLKRKPDGSYAVYDTPFIKASVPVRGIRVDVDAPVLFLNNTRVWIGSKGKVLSYNPMQKTFYDEPFRAYVKNTWAGDSAIFNQRSEIPYTQNNIRFQFAATFLEDADKIEYQYKLSGFRGGWSAWSTSNEAGFTNLPHGNYALQMRSRNVYQQVTEPTVYAFSIAPPWYKTWYAFVIYLVLASAFVSLIVRLNTQRIRKQKLKLEAKVRKKTKALRKRNREIQEKREQIEKQALELEVLNVTKDKLFSIVSHDLRAPVRQIQVVMDLMDLKYVGEDDFKKFLPKFRESIDYTVHLTDNLLHWANSQMEGIRVSPTHFNLKEIAAENMNLFKPVADAKNIIIDNHIDTELPAFADKEMIRLVLRNLVNNAIKFTFPGKRVTIGGENKTGLTKIFVKDEGIGLSAADIEAIVNNRITSRHGTGGEKGAGLGLVLCKDFIHKNRGSLSIESEPGKGSTFTVSVPARHE